MGFWDSLNNFAGGPLGSLAIGLGTEAIASNIQRRAVNSNVQQQQAAIDQARARTAPYAAAGQQGLMRISDILAEDRPTSFQFDESKVALDPGYNFRMEEARKAIARSQAGRLSGGGAALKELDAYTQGLASEEYSDAYGRAYRSQMDTYNTGQQDRQARYGRALTLADMGAQAERGLQDLDTSYGAVGGGGAMARGQIGAGGARRVGGLLDPVYRGYQRLTLDDMADDRRERIQAIAAGNRSTPVAGRYGNSGVSLLDVGSAPRTASTSGWAPSLPGTTPQPRQDKNHPYTAY